MDATDQPVRNPFWRNEIAQAMADVGESWDDYVAHTGADLEKLEANPWVPRWTLWTRKRVYFPHDYDGQQTARSAPRNPCDDACSA